MDIHKYAVCYEEGKTKFKISISKLGREITLHNCDEELALRIVDTMNVLANHVMSRSDPIRLEKAFQETKEFNRAVAKGVRKEKGELRKDLNRAQKDYDKACKEIASESAGRTKELRKMAKVSTDKVAQVEKTLSSMNTLLGPDFKSLYTKMFDMISEFQGAKAKAGK